MGVVERLAERIKSIVRKKPAEELRIDAQKGRIVITARDMRAKMELFKLFPKRGSWGFELVLENRSGRDISGIMVWFSHAKHSSLERLPAEKIAIKTVEFALDEIPLAVIDLRLERTVGGQRYSSHFALDMALARAQLEAAGKFDVIEEQEAPKAGASIQTWRSEPARQARKPEQPQAQAADPHERLAQIAKEKDDLMAQFMRRKIDYQNYNQLVNALQKEELDLRARVSQKR